MNEKANRVLLLILLIKKQIDQWLPSEILKGQSSTSRATNYEKKTKQSTIPKSLPAGKMRWGEVVGAEGPELAWWRPNGNAYHLGFFWLQETEHLR